MARDSDSSAGSQGEWNRLVLSTMADGYITAAAPDLQRRILADLTAATAPLSREALRATIRVRNDSLGVALRQLEASGIVQRTPRGWSLADRSLPAP